MMIEWQPLINTKIIKTKLFGRGLDGFDTFAVTEIRSGQDYYSRNYWVKWHETINCIYNEISGKITGAGSKKYEKEIKEAVHMFKMQGIDKGKVVLLPPHKTPSYQPAVMYDSRNYNIFYINDLEKLEKMYFQLHKAIPDIYHEDICILKLPLRQEIIDDIWIRRSIGLEEFLQKEMFGL